LPASTGFGVPVFVSAKSACPAVATTVVTVATLFDGFGSVVAADTFAVSVMIVPEGTAAPTLTTTVKVVDAPLANVGIVQEIEAPEQVQPPVPDVAATDTNEVFAGSASVNATVLDVPGPLFVITTV
jgi:hypothetical protein